MSLPHHLDANIIVLGGIAEGLDQGFRVVINDGRHGSQSVYHLVPFLGLDCI